MEVRRCMKCMHELAAGQTVCPVCGRTYGSAKAEPFALKPGTILDGKYLVGEVLGQGGFGITYIGLDLLLEQKVAIKEYFPMSTGMVSRENSSTVVWSSVMMGKNGTQRGFDSFLKEARKMAKLGGIPNVVGVKSVFIQNETAYIVMDFIEGETLLSKLQRDGSMEYHDCLSMLTPIIRALAEVHKHGIIHRDISPDNIMVQKDGKLVLLDLGAAKDIDIQGADGSVQSSQMVAKHGFSPVEQYGRGGKIGPWTDVYAMAATIYYCCTGVLPPFATDRAIDDTLCCKPRLTKDQFGAIAFCMTVFPQNRPQNMEVLLQILNAAAAGIPETEPVRKPREAESKNRPQETEPVKNPEKTEPVEPPKETEPVKSSPPQEEKQEKNKKNKVWLIALAAILICAVCTVYGYSHCWFGHIWKEAICTAPATCTRCGATNGNALGHDWQAATCVLPKTCKRCGATTGVAAGHNWIEATYSTPKTCQVCGATEGYVKGYMPSVSGHFSEESVSFGNTSWNSYIFNSPLEKCTKFTFNLTVPDTKQGNPFGEWRIYMRNQWGGWVQIGSIKLKSSSASAEIVLDTPTTITEIFVGAPYGWTPGFSASFSVTDIYTKE